MRNLVCTVLLAIAPFATAYSFDFHNGKKESPKPDTLFAWIEVCPGKPPCERQTIYISHFRPKIHKSVIDQWNWYSFKMGEIKRLLNYGIPIHYIP